MLKDFEPIYKEEERPLIGFHCKSTGGATTDISINSIGGCNIEFHMYGGMCGSSWCKSDLQDFINNLQKVCNNMK